MAFNFERRDSAEQQQFTWDDLKNGEAVFDDEQLFAKTDDGWVSFEPDHTLAAYLKEETWYGKRVRITGVTFE